MSLTRYRAKRNLKKSHEPRAKKSKQKNANRYVFHQHASRNLHFDLRLELEGVLKSWAIPKGPSLNPKVKRLAVHVEDHPLDYATFEGIIPQGHYGAGIVMVWDKGHWECQDEDPLQAYKDGHLTFILKGKKLHGLWKLIRFQKTEDNWLLIKVKDDYSEKKELTMSETKKRKMPDTVHPQLVTLVSKPPQGDSWLHEAKFDGYRLLCFINKNTIKILTRNQNNWTSKFPFLVRELKKLKISTAIFDGELVAINDDGEFDFQLLQNSIHEKKTENLCFYVFDIIYYNGYDLSEMSLLKRKELLHSLLPENNKYIIFSEYSREDGDEVYKKACESGLEGIVSKKADSPYVQARTKYWVKSKCVKRQEFIICGYTKPGAQRQHFGSLLLGIYKNDKLIYCGNVGTGFSEKSLESIAKLLKKYEIPNTPFSAIPKNIKNVTWVKPEIIAEVEFMEWTREKLLRHPSFKGIRYDKSAKDVVIEKPISSKSVSSKKYTSDYSLTHPDRLLYPKSNITKVELAEFYDDIHEWILPYIINRPLTLYRCPHGIEKNCFYQRHLVETSFNDLYGIDIKEKGKNKPFSYIKDKKGLLALVQLGVLEIHPWGIQIDNLEKPDILVFDLDPDPDLEWKYVIQAARFVRDQLEKLNLKSFVKTTGGKGLHITIPIKRLYDWTEIKDFAQAFAKTIASIESETFTAVMSKSKRKGKIFIDYLRNQQGATAIAPYSARARPDAPVATPLRWDELSVKIKPNFYTIKNLPKRLHLLKSDPWEGFFSLHQTLNLIHLAMHA